jgi:acetylornithine aminotransferase/acetylornithine/N-succinyldiaminopimelate aminotransferase
MHASTFGGNPVSSAAALAVMDVIEEEALVKRAEESGHLFVEGLALFVEKYKQVLEVRGKGLMVGLVVEGDAKEVVVACREMGLLCCVAGEHVVRFLPPLSVKEGDLEEALEMVGDALENLYGEREEA